MRRISDLDEATQRAIQRKVDQADGQYSDKSRWLTVRTAGILLDAIKAGKNWVILDNRTFLISYGKDGKAWVRPNIGFSPCGRYTEKILEGIIQTGGT